MVGPTHSCEQRDLATPSNSGTFPLSDSDVSLSFPTHSSTCPFGVFRALVDPHTSLVNNHFVKPRRNSPGRGAAPSWRSAGPWGRTPSRPCCRTDLEEKGVEF